MSTANVSQETSTVGETQVLTFTLGDEIYCLAIEYVAEIVDGGELTALPDSDEYVEGLMDLRGQTTTIVNPSKILETNARELVTDGGRSDHRLVVLDAEAVNAESPVGWVVSEVHEVKTITEAVVDTTAVGDTDLLRGLVAEDGEFTLWLNPLEFST